MSHALTLITFIPLIGAAVILALRWPAADGLTVVRALRDRGRAVPILLLTSQEDSDSGHRRWINGTNLEE